MNAMTIFYLTCTGISIVILALLQTKKGYKWIVGVDKDEDENLETTAE